MSSRQYLVVDPDAGQRQLLDLLLADGETTIVAFETARQTLEFLRSNTPALAVLAYALPDMPGIEVCKRLKLVARLQDVPVIVTLEPLDTFGVPEPIRAEAADAGVDLLLPKPLGDKALRERANRLIQTMGDGKHSPHRNRPRHDTGVIEQSLKELEAKQRGESVQAGPGTQPAPKDAEELGRLRDENAKLKRRVVGQMDAIAKLQAELDELKQRTSKRGLFGRRKSDQ